MQTKNRPGCLTEIGILAAIVTLLAIGWNVFTQGGMLYSPGPLNAQTGEVLGGVKSHAETNGNCKSCHAAPWERETMADRCADCHGGITLQMKDVASIHGRMLHNAPDLTCRHCHPEHRGADAPLTEMNRGEFPHEVVGFSLQGHKLTSENDPFVCDDCHKGDVSSFVSDTCSNCHADLDPVFALGHSIEYGDACLECHDGVDRLSKNLKHDFEFVLLGKHEGLICSKCHTNARAFTDFQNTAGDCQSCHRADDPHAGKFGSDCAGCHNESDWTDATFDHNKSGFPLAGRHTDLTCEQCHSPDQYSTVSAECVSCHADPIYHAGMFGFDCASCHTTENWFARYNGSHPGIADEGGTGINHGETSCRTCHTQSLSSATCMACHDSNNPEGGGGGDGGGDD